MTTSTPETVYALSAKGVAIPLDVARPVAGVMETKAVNDSISYALKAGRLTLISAYSSDFATLEVRDATLTVLATFHMVPDTLYDMSVSSPTDGTVVITNKGASPAVLIVNELIRWTQLDNQTYGIS